MWHPNWQTHVQTEIRQIAKPFDFPTVFSLFGHFLCKCRALPQTCAVRRKPFPYNNRTFANIAEPKKGLIMNTWQVQKKKWTPTFDDYRFTIHYLLRRIDDILISVFFIVFWCTMMIDVLGAYYAILSLHTFSLWHSNHSNKKRCRSA